MHDHSDQTRLRRLILAAQNLVRHSKKANDGLVSDQLICDRRQECAQEALEDLLKGVSPDKVHPLIEPGPDVGNEVISDITEAHLGGATPRTSITSPLRIDTINLAYGTAAIGMTLCPGKQGPSEYGLAWLRDLKLDMTVLKEWGCNALLTLMESDELRRFNVLDIGEIAQDTGIKWYHIPITDGEPPDARFTEAWPVIGPELLNILKNGDRVVIHCRGGLGRTGMIACLLLIDLGISPLEAIRIVRITRPGAVETAAQEAFIIKYKPEYC